MFFGGAISRIAPFFFDLNSSNLMMRLFCPLSFIDIIRSMELIESKGLCLFQSNLLAARGITHGFTTKEIEGASSPSISPEPDDLEGQALQKLRETFGLVDHHMVFQRQVHGDNITVIKDTDLKGQITVVPENDARGHAGNGPLFDMHRLGCEKI